MENNNLQDTRRFNIHLISDATGTTLQGMVRAVLPQFGNIEPQEWFWPLVRNERQLRRVFDQIEKKPGPVVFTFVDNHMRLMLEEECDKMSLPSIPALDPLMKGLSSYLGLPVKGIPGLQHSLDEAYFKRIEAIEFMMRYDDGQSLEGIERAEVILIGVSRTSKTPTCLFLARRGIKSANIPFTPNVPIPEKIKTVQGPLIVCLTETAERLVALRKSRLKRENDNGQLIKNDYLDIEKVEQEIRDCKRFCTQHKWPCIDVTKRSVEETAAEIMVLLQKRKTEKKR